MEMLQSNVKIIWTVLTNNNISQMCEEQLAFQKT